MKKQINIWNPYNSNEIVTLKHLRKMILERRYNALKRSVKKGITVMTTNNKLQQVAAHYKSFEIKQMPLEKAIEVFNLNGCQKATVIN